MIQAKQTRHAAPPLFSLSRSSRCHARTRNTSLHPPPRLTRQSLSFRIPCAHASQRKNRKKLFAVFALPLYFPSIFILFLEKTHYLFFYITSFPYLCVNSMPQRWCRKDFIVKVLLKLSSILKLRNFDDDTKMMAVAPHHLIYTYPNRSEYCQFGVGYCFIRVIGSAKT